jgi:hypothetical protein
MMLPKQGVCGVAVVRKSVVWKGASAYNKAIVM